MSRNSQARPLDPFLFEVSAWTGAAVQTLRLSTHTIATEPTDTPADTLYQGRISDPGTLKWSMFDGTATAGRASVDPGFLEAANADCGLDAYFGYQWGRIAVIKSLPARNAPVTSATEIFRATVVGLESSDAFHTLRFRLRSRMTELDAPLLSARYAGTTISLDDTIEGDETLTGQIKPYIFGSVATVPLKPVNRFRLIYQVCANAVSSIAVSDGGIVLTNAGDYGSLPSLINASIPAGQYATCVAQGLVRLASNPAYQLRADVVEGATLSVRSAARVCQRIMALVATISGTDIDTATFDAFHAFNAGEVGIYIDSDRTALDVLSDVAGTPGGTIIQGPGGLFQAKWLQEPSSTVAASLTQRDLLKDGGSIQLFVGPSNEGQGVPAWSIVLTYARIWSTMSTGDLAPVIAEATTGADLALKTRLATDKLKAVAQDANVKTTSPHAVELTFDSLFTSAADANLEAARRLALYKVRRDRLTFPTTFDIGNVQLGASVKITFTPPRLGYQAGKNFLVLGREDNLKRKTRTLTLWG